MTETIESTFNDEEVYKEIDNRTVSFIDRFKDKFVPFALGDKFAKEAAQNEEPIGTEIYEKEKMTKLKNTQPKFLFRVPEFSGKKINTGIDKTNNI